MSHINFFIHQLELEKNKKFTKHGKKGGHSGWVRPTAIYVVWKFSGLSVREVAEIFYVNRVNVWHVIRQRVNWVETKNELFCQQYNEILTFYIKTTKAYLKRNQIYNLKNVA